MGALCALLVIGLGLLIVMYVFGTSPAAAAVGAVGLVLVVTVVLRVRGRKPRMCPHCGADAPRGLLVCPRCGYDFGAATRAAIGKMDVK